MKIEVLLPPFGAEFNAIIPALYTGGMFQVKQTQPYAPTHLAAGFLLRSESGQLLGRAALYNNPQLQLDEMPVIVLGAYECVEDNLASSALLTAVKTYAATNFPNSTIIGPMDGSTWQTYRFVTKGLDQAPFLFEPFSLPYYPNQWQAAGFEPLMSYASNLAHIDESLRSDHTDYQREFENKGLVFRTLDTINQDAELQRLARFNLTSFQSAFLFSTISEAEFVEKNRNLITFLQPELVHVVLDGDDICGLILAYPDKLDRLGKTAVVKTLARLPGSRYRGLGDLLCTKIVSTLLDAGFDKMIHALMRTGNDSLVNSSKFWGEPYKEYQLFQHRPA